jgi:hypothetical protein
MTTGPESGADTAGAAGAAGSRGTEAGGLVDALWQAARVAERRTAYQLDRLDRLAGGAATSRDAPGEPQPGSAGPPPDSSPDPYWITAEALRQRHLRERRLLVAAAALVAELWQWEARGQPPPEGPGPDVPAAPGASAGGGPDAPTPSPAPASAAPASAAPASAAPGGAAGAGARPAPAEWGRTDAALEYWMRREGWRRASAVALRAFLAAAGSPGWCVHCGRPALELRLYVQEGQNQGPRSRAFSRCGACGLVGELQPGTALAAAGQVAPPPAPPAPPAPPSALPDQEAGYG